jgi:2-C-methyl-D-erythritol 4-phosphate cytidylyltransferase
MIQRYAIIVAGGTGQRFGSQIPKQFITLKGYPILYHTLKAFYTFDRSIQLIVVLPSDYMEFWRSQIEEFKIDIPHKQIVGGETRFHSVKNGLEAINNNGLVAIHDAVRPMVSQETLQRCFETAAYQGNAVPVISLFDSLRQLTYDTSIQVDRNAYVLVQTPQIFDIATIKKAYQVPYSDEFTDDALVYEKAGNKVFLVDGNRENIKITTKMDLIIADALLNHIILNRI